MNHQTSLGPVLGSPKTSQELLDLYFLDMRSALLETAAALDRIQRAENGDDIFEDPRIQKLNQAFEIFKSGKQGRAEQFLRLLSEPVEP